MRYAQIEVIRKADTLAEVAIAMGEAVRKEARAMATMMGLDYREITGGSRLRPELFI